jgi:adenylate kinase
MPVYIVLLGPPGVGKGTQAELVAGELGLPHVSSGDLFRENIQRVTALGKQARSYIDRGELVPDELTIAMIRERLAQPDCKTGALLDGFPRTTVQAAALEKLLAEFGGKVAVVPFINAPAAVLVERLGGRWTCRAAGHVFHATHNPPRVAGVCDLDGSELYQREDDQPETVARRIQVYLAQTMPLVEYYRKRGSLKEIDGARSIEQVTSDLLAAIEVPYGAGK